jgi:hypothetical protein
MRVTLNKIASATQNARIGWEVHLSQEIPAEEGIILAVRVRGTKTVYNQVENPDGRLVPLDDGDLLAGVLGSRRALRGYAGVVPESIRAGDRLHILNLGGVIGRCTSINPEIGPPLEAEVLGVVLTFPDPEHRTGLPATIKANAVPAAERLEPSAPVLYVAGTCMNSGKTSACSEIVRYLVKAGHRVCGAKLTGVSLRRDVLSMEDRGAFRCLSFNEAGMVSTSAEHIVPVAKGLLNALNRERPDCLVAELGDGILGEYGVQQILGDPELMSVAKGHVLCAADPVAAWGAAELYRTRFRQPLLVIAGPATDNDIGKRFIEDQMGIRALNARLEPAVLGELVRQALFPKSDQGHRRRD